MNIIDIIQRNHFIKQLYPEGIGKLAVVSFSTDLINFVLKVRTDTKPAIKTAKWGEWLTDYDTVEIELRNNYIKDISCSNWWNNTKCNCLIDIQDIGDDLKKIRFYSIIENWYLEIAVHSLTFQGCKVYLKSQEDYYAI